MPPRPSSAYVRQCVYGARVQVGARFPAYDRDAVPVNQPARYMSTLQQTCVCDPSFTLPVIMHFSQLHL